jgi:hypothetical protein
MRLRTWVCVGVAAACAAAGVTLAAPGLPRRLGLDFWAAGGLRREMEATRRAIERVDDELAEVRERAAIKDAVLSELAAGRLTLREAAEQCREATPPSAWAAHLANLRFHHPGLTDEECVCRNLIAGVRLELAGSKSAAVGAAVARLEAEWRAVAEAEDVTALRARAGLLGVEPAPGERRQKK